MFPRNLMSPSFIFGSQNGRSIFLGNVVVYLQFHTALQPRILTSTFMTYKFIKNYVFFFRDKEKSISL